jgi:hypothetical protein
MIGFKGRFILKQYLPGKHTKWGIADSSNGYLLKCDIYRVSQEESATLREGVPYVKIY